MAKAIKYIVTPDGEITLDFNGFKGKACITEFKKILEELEKNFGVKVDSGAIRQELKPEYYQEEVQQVRKRPSFTDWG